MEVMIAFTWSWFAFAMGVLSLLVLEFVVLFVIAAKQYNAKKKQTSDLEQALKSWSKKTDK